MKHLLLLTLLAPGLCWATGYHCKGPNGWEAFKAGSFEEARYLSQSKWHQTVPCISGDPSDSFDVDAFFSTRQHLRPFLPKDIRRPPAPQHDRGRAPQKGAVDLSSFRCGVDGNFTPDGSSDQSRCSLFESASMGKWKVRSTSLSQDDFSIWRLPNGDLHGPAKFWVHVAPGGVSQVSKEALDYARGRGFTVNAPATTTSVIEAPDPNAPRIVDCKSSSLGINDRLACINGTANTGPAATPAPRGDAAPAAAQAAPAAGATTDCSHVHGFVAKAKCIADAAKTGATNGK